MCGKCSEDFFRSNGVCNECPASSSTLIFVIGDVVVWVGFALAAVLIRDRMALSYVVMTVRALQMLSGVGSMTEGDDIPKWVLSVYSVLHIFSGDYSFVKPDCVTPVPFEVTFAVSIAYNIAVFVPVFAFIAIASRIAPGHAEYADVGEPGRGEAEDEEGTPTAGSQARGKYFWRDRAVRMVVIWGAVMYLSLTSLAFETLSCTPNAIGEYRMVTKPHERCFVGSHVALSAVASMILVGYTLGFPLGMLRWVKTEENAPKLHLDERFMERWNFLYEFYNIKNPTFWLVEFPITCIVAAGKSLLKPHVNYQMSISVAVFAYKLLYIIVRRPFIDWITDVIQAVLALVSMIAINMTFFDRHGVFEKIPAMSTSMAILIIVVFAVAIISMLGMVSWLLVQPPGSLKALGHHNLDVHSSEFQGQHDTGADVEEFDVVTEDDLDLKGVAQDDADTDANRDSLDGDGEGGWAMPAFGWMNDMFQAMFTSSAEPALEAEETGDASPENEHDEIQGISQDTAADETLLALPQNSVQVEDQPVIADDAVESAEV